MKHDRITIDFVRHWSALGYTRREICVGMGLGYELVRRYSLSRRDRKAMAPAALKVGAAVPCATCGSPVSTVGPGVELPS